MLSEEKIKEMYEDQLERCIGYYFVAVRDRRKEDLYGAHLWALFQIGKILGIPGQESLDQVRQLVGRDKGRSA